MLELSGVQAELCVQLLYGAVSFPQAPVVGQAELLQVSLGPSFDGETLDDSMQWPTHLHVDPSGTAEAATDDTATGAHQLTFTPTGTREVVLDVRGCLSTAPELPVLHDTLCQTAVVVRGFEIDPTEVTVGAGAVYDFDALLFGLPHPAVAWSATAGTIDEDGVFVAPTREGTVTVTATSETTPGLTRAATVTVGEPCMAAPRIYTVSSEELDGTDVVVGPSPTPVELHHGTGFAETGANSARATMGSVDDRYGFYAHVEFGIGLTPVLPEDVDVPVVVTVSVAFDVSGFDEDDPPEVAAYADCGSDGLSFYPPGNDTYVTEPGTYTFDVHTQLGATVDCALEAVGDVAVGGSPPVVEVSWGGIVDVQTTADYTICSN